MNWRPASPFDACLANELVRFALKRDRYAAAATVLVHGYGMWETEYAKLIGCSGLHAHKLNREGRVLMARACRLTPRRIRVIDQQSKRSGRKWSDHYIW